MPRRLTVRRQTVAPVEASCARLPMLRCWLPYATTVTLGCLLTGCDTAPPAADRTPQSRPAPQSQPEPSPAATQPTETQPAPPEPKLPEYMTIVARFHAADRAHLEVRTEPNNRLIIDTRNVRRLHIDRAKLPLDKNRRIILLLDGQGIEWLARSPVSDFARSPNGEWLPVKPHRPAQPKKPVRN